jgi:hypothetical protein
MSVVEPNDIPSDPADATSVELERLTSNAAVDRDHSVRLSGEAARQMCDGLGQATREGLMLVRAARPGETYRLVPPKDLAKGIREGTLRHATPASGDASVLVKEAKSGRIAGKSDLKKVKPNALKVLGPAAWQAMALATQQHYLVEISGKLDGLRRGLDEVLARLDDDRVGTLNHLREKADDVMATLARGDALPRARVADLRDAADVAKELWHQIATTARRQLDAYREGTTSAQEAEESFAMLAQATQVLAHCSDALLAVPYGTAEELEQAFAEERDRMLPALPDFRRLVVELLAASGTWSERHDEFEASRPKHPAPRLVNAIKPLPVHIGPRRPVQEPLDDNSRWRYGQLAPVEAHGSPSLLVEVLDGGDVLIGCQSQREGDARSA